MAIFCVSYGFILCVSGGDVKILRRSGLTRHGDNIVVHSGEIHAFSSFMPMQFTVIFSSPEPLCSQGELIVYPGSGICPSSFVCPSSVCRLSVHHFQRSSSLKPLGQSKPYFIWSRHGKEEPKFI